jgi:glutamate dehydrogenase
MTSSGSVAQEPESGPDSGGGWQADLRDELVERYGEREGTSLYAEVGDAFPLSYRVLCEPARAATDIERLRALDDGELLASGFVEDAGGTRFVVSSREPISLSAVLPVLEQLGVQIADERAFELQPHDSGPRWIYEFGVRWPAKIEAPDDRTRAEFCAAFQAAWTGRIESDGFNRLVVLAGLTALQATVLRAIAKYLRQIGIRFSQSYLEEALASNASIARQLVELFETRLDPRFDGNRSLEMSVIAGEITKALDRIPSLDEDRMLRAFFQVVQATVRTNLFQRGEDGAVPLVLSFKLDPAALAELLPAPHPAHEIWVYSPQVEGVHLRGGRVARGGIRWSDRREDFRTEVLGLMKAQMVKNAVIVPTGAKGGFVVKRPPSEPEALRAEVEACYRAFIDALLDVTDNIVRGAVVAPADVVCHDGDDPYLVVAADKGTATYSDIANEVAAAHGYWLGDAFASGGGDGFDHKEMGITARGAWESVRHHFRLLGIDADTAPITCIGIGDMSGDVFGNGMLLSQHLRLVAAFDHRHVFVDPEPDSAAAWQERKRLFDLPASSWADYDRTKLSSGGGIWPRSAKKIELSEEARARLDLAATVLTPGELIGAILRAPVDLLWNGGIGTYVKASTETNAEVGDRANDAVRIDAADLRCRVVAEGGNLGVTQRARVEFALAGGSVNTDAIDNSAGVDTSDYEVNIKILLDGAIAGGELTHDDRSALLRAETDEVADAVLEDNRAQNLALALSRVHAADMVDVHARYIRALEHDGRVDRGLEYLPTDKQLAERQASGLGLTRPELAVLLAYTKLTQVDAILASGLPDDPEMRSELVAYFPPELQARFGHRADLHPLRREIVATELVNQVVNRAGTTFEFRMAEETGATPADILRCALAARSILRMPEQWDAVCQLTVDADVQLALLLDLRRLAERSVLWLLRHRRPPLAIDPTVAAFRDGATVLAAELPTLASGAHAVAMADAAERARVAGVPAELASRAAAWPYLHTSFDIIEVANARGRTPADVARVYWGLFERLDLEWLWDRIGLLPRTDRWQSHARAGLRDDLLEELRTLSDDALRAGDVFTPPQELVARWADDNARAADRVRAVFGQIRSGGVFDLTTLSVALRQLRNLVLSSGPAS